MLHDALPHLTLPGIPNGHEIYFSNSEGLASQQITYDGNYLMISKNTIVQNIKKFNILIWEIKKKNY